MFKSDSIAALADALSKAQDEMKNAVKDSSNPFFKSKYADLASVTDACRHELAKNGLAVVQLPSVRDGKVVLEYCLLHASGEFIGSELEMTPVKNDPQGIGSAITYARRYSLAGITGVATEDDDGNAASGNTESARKARPTTEDIEIKSKKTEIWKREPEPVAAQEEFAKTDQRAPNKVSTASEAPTGASEMPASRQPQGTAVEIPGADCIDQGMATNFNLMFKDALPPKHRKNADQIRHDWLRSQEILDVLGKPSAYAIKKENFYEVREAAVDFAKRLQ